MNTTIKEVEKQEPIELIKWRISRECYVVLELRGIVTQEAVGRLVKLLQNMQDCYPPDGEADCDHPLRVTGDVCLNCGAKDEAEGGKEETWIMR